VTRAVDSQAAIRNYINWHDHGYLSATDECFDIGTATLKALKIWQRYFDRFSIITIDDLAGREGGQPEIDKALKHEVLSYHDVAPFPGLIRTEILWKRLSYARFPNRPCILQ
jgi:hypothetical protein